MKGGGVSRGQCQENLLGKRSRQDYLQLTCYLKNLQAVSASRESDCWPQA